MENQQDYLQNLEAEIILRPASVGARFLNYIIDLVAYYVLVFLCSMLLVLLSITPIGLDGGSDGGFEFAFLFIGIFSYILYYMVLEGALKGKTVGKLVTRTRAVSGDGSAITWKQAALRALIRLIPFEIFSAFGGYPWHDTWAGTVVVSE